MKVTHTHHEIRQVVVPKFFMRGEEFTHPELGPVQVCEGELAQVRREDGKIYACVRVPMACPEGCDYR